MRRLVSILLAVCLLCALGAAAAENEEERAKDLTKVAENVEEVKKNTETADAMQASGAEKGVRTLLVNGKPISGNIIPIPAEGSILDVQVTMG